MAATACIAWVPLMRTYALTVGSVLRIGMIHVRLVHIAPQANQFLSQLGALFNLLMRQLFIECNLLLLPILSFTLLLSTLGPLNSSIILHSYDHLLMQSLYLCLCLTQSLVQPLNCPVSFNYGMFEFSIFERVVVLGITSSPGGLDNKL